MPTLLNIEKSNYGTSSLFLDEQGLGVVDTVNKKHPEIFKLYKKMKQLDWDENEFNFSSCVADFQTCDKATYDMMIKTLAFQWEADSIASRISVIAGCVVTSTELWAAWGRISDNEMVHALTYSEIVRNSFEDPRDIMNEITKVQESFNRLSVVHKALDNISKLVHNYAAGNKVDMDDLYDHCFLFPVVMLLLERMQFMSSFAVTFGICETGRFTPIGKSVQKICQDEFEVHCELDKAVIRTEMKTERGVRAYNRWKPTIIQMINEIRTQEHDWVDYLMPEGVSLPGITNGSLKRWSDYNIRPVTTFLNLDIGVRLPKENPLKFMEDWIDINAIQASPQEEDNGQYKVNVMKNDSDGVIFDDF